MVCIIQNDEQPEQGEFKLLKEKAEQGDIDAQKSLADCYFYGDGVEKDYVQAVKWFEILITGKKVDWIDTCIRWKLVNCYSKGGYGLEPNYSKTEEWLKKIVECNNRDEFWERLSDFYFEGEGKFKPNPIKGIEWLEKSAEQGYVRAQIELAECYFQGIGIEKNTDKAIEWFKKAAEQGCADAQNRLAECYFQGISVEKNTDKAIEWLKKAAFEDGTGYDCQSYIGRNRIYRHWITVIKARRQLAFRYFFGKEVNQDYMEALNWFKSSRKVKIFDPLPLINSSYDNNYSNVELAIFSCFAGDKRESFEILKSCNNGYAKLWIAYFYYLRHKPDIEKISNKDACDPYSKSYEGEDKGELGLEEYNRLLDIKYDFHKNLINAGYQLFYKDIDSWVDISAEIYISDDTFHIIFHEKIIDFLENTDNSSAKNILAYYHQYKNEIETALKYFESSRDILAFVELGKYYEEKKEFDKAIEYYKKIEECQFCHSYNREQEQKIKELAERRIEIIQYHIEHNKEIEEKNKELNNLIAMFAHNFLGTLQCIRSNAEHNNNPKIHLKTVKMMSGALTAFSIISADDDKLIEQLKQDNKGDTTLLQNLANNLSLAVSQLLSQSNKDKIINLYLHYLRKTNQITAETDGEELRFNNADRKKWQALQHQWEDEFNALFSENVDLPQLQNWLETNFFPVQISGFTDYTIRFNQYGITDSIFLVVFMEILVNALKYMDVSQHQPLTITLCKQDQHYQLTCENPSAQESYRGTHKGMDFLKSIAKKINGQFTTESTAQSFKSTFIIPAELLE